MARLRGVAAAWQGFRSTIMYQLLLRQKRWLWYLLATATVSLTAAVGQADPGEALGGSGAPTGVGGSLVASPFGEVVASAGAHPDLVVTDIDVDRVADARESIAVLRNRSDFARADRAESIG